MTRSTWGKNAKLSGIDGGSEIDTSNTQTTGFHTRNIEAIDVVCYAPGTLFDTPDGSRAVEDLQVGDLVMTIDNGPQPIRWARSGTLPPDDDADTIPVPIGAGALAPGIPERDLVVSPQHRILVGRGQLPGKFGAEAFAPAKALTSLRGIRHMNGKRNISWVHFACKRHEVVVANGCLLESLLNGPPARECMTVGAVRRQLKQAGKAKADNVAAEIRQWDLDLAFEEYEADRLRDARSAMQGWNRDRGVV